MKVSLKSVMELAHSIKRRYQLSMRDALKLAWIKAKGFAYAAEISVLKVDRSIERVYLPALDYDTCTASRIAYTREINNARRAASYRADTVHSWHEIRI